MTKIKGVTHLLALGVGAILAFSLTPAGQAIVMQYPKASAFVTLLSTAAALYHQPSKPA